MDKRAFLSRLRDSLASLSRNEVEDILRDYEEHFRAGLESGRSESEIVASLGSPEEIARQYTASFSEGATPVEGPQIDRTKMWIAGAILLALNVTALFSPFMTLLGIWLLCWIIAAVGLIVGVGLLVAGIANLAIPVLNFLTAPFLLFFGLGTVALSALCWIGLLWLSGLAAKAIRWWVSFNISLARKAGGEHAA